MQQNLEFTQKGVKNIKHPMTGSPAGKNAFLIMEVREVWSNLFGLTGSDSNSNHHSLQPE